LALWVLADDIADVAHHRVPRGDVGTCVVAGEHLDELAVGKWVAIVGLADLARQLRAD